MIHQFFPWQFVGNVVPLQNTSINQAIRDELLENIKNMLHKNE